MSLPCLFLNGSSAWAKDLKIMETFWTLVDILVELFRISFYVVALIIVIAMFLYGSDQNRL